MFLNLRYTMPRVDVSIFQSLHICPPRLPPTHFAFRLFYSTLFYFRSPSPMHVFTYQFHLSSSILARKLILSLPPKSFANDLISTLRQYHPITLFSPRNMPIPVLYLILYSYPRWCRRGMGREGDCAYPPNWHHSCDSEKRIR